MANRNISRRGRIFITLVGLVVIEAVLGFYLLRTPADGLGMRRILARVINSSDEKIYLRQKSPVQTEGFSQPDLDSLRPMVQPLVNRAPGGLEIAIALRDWASRNLEVSLSAPPDLSISDLVAGIKGPEVPPPVWCDSYAKIFLLAAHSVGVEARIVHLSADAGPALQAHYANEVWVSELSKWVLMDAFFNLYIQIDGQPASALEIHKVAFGLTPAERIVIKKGASQGEFSPKKYLDNFQCLQIVGGPVFSSGKELLLKNKRIVFYNFVDEVSPPLRRRDNAVIFLFKYILPLLILLFFILLLSTYRRARRGWARRPRERLPFLLPPRREDKP